MTINVHRILIDGPEFISTAILPIGQFSEEEQVSRNKDMQHFRKSHTRKISMENTGEDLLHFLLIS
jgi:hypothetical protein